MTLEDDIVAASGFSARHLTRVTARLARNRRASLTMRVSPTRCVPWLFHSEMLNSRLRLIAASCSGRSREFNSAALTLNQKVAKGNK